MTGKKDECRMRNCHLEELKGRKVMTWLQRKLQVVPVHMAKCLVKTDLIHGPASLDCYGRVAPRSGLASQRSIFDVGAGVID